MVCFMPGVEPYLEGFLDASPHFSHLILTSRNTFL